METVRSVTGIALVLALRHGQLRVTWKPAVNNRRTARARG
jgi:hypothetical protein